MSRHLTAALFAVFRTFFYFQRFLLPLNLNNFDFFSVFGAWKPAFDDFLGPLRQRPIEFDAVSGAFALDSFLDMCIYLLSFPLLQKNGEIVVEYRRLPDSVLEEYRKTGSNGVNCDYA